MREQPTTKTHRENQQQQTMTRTIGLRCLDDFKCERNEKNFSFHSIDAE